MFQQERSRSVTTVLVCNRRLHTPTVSSKPVWTCRLLKNRTQLKSSSTSETWPCMSCYLSLLTPVCLIFTLHSLWFCMKDLMCEALPWLHWETTHIQGSLQVWKSTDVQIYLQMTVEHPDNIFAVLWTSYLRRITLHQYLTIMALIKNTNNKSCARRRVILMTLGIVRA